MIFWFAEEEISVKPGILTRCKRAYFALAVDEFAEEYAFCYLQSNKNLFYKQNKKPK